MTCSSKVNAVERFKKAIFMTELVLKTSKWALEWTGLKHFAHPSRLLLIALLTIMMFSTELRPLILGAMSDAYLAVTVFVAATLAVFYMLERGLGIDLGRKMAGAKHWQAPIASFLGALPGCGGAIIVVTQYTKGMISFGSVVAVLISTMGDAAFLLLAREPLTGAAVLATGFICGSVAGWIIDYIHGPNFMRPSKEDYENKIAEAQAQLEAQSEKKPFSLDFLNNVWLALLIPSIVIGLALAFLVDVDALFGATLAKHEPTLWIGATGALLCLLLWAFSNPEQGHVGQEVTDINGQSSMLKRVMKDTNFVTSWVVFGFLAYELGVHFTGSGIESWFQTWAPFVPLIAILVGFIPGCGPQIVVVTMYLNGLVPVAALYGNAIANDGDALFPAIALAPKAAILATLYSAVPALIIAYGIYFAA